MKFVFDLDGTLCFDCKMISDPITQAIQRLEEKGHQIYFASARPIRICSLSYPKFFTTTLWLAATVLL